MAAPVTLPPDLSASFRDPSGSLVVSRDAAYRTVYADAAPAARDFLASSLSAALVAEGSLVATEILESHGSAGDLLLRHERVAFISYPWEWPPALWYAAATLTLDLSERLLAEGWLLKDATPLNVLFRGSRPVFVDVLSVQPLDPEKPLWYAYAQFVRTFILPLLANLHLGWPLAGTLTERDGYQPEEIAEALPLAARLRPSVLTTVTLPTLLGKHSASAAAPRPPSGSRDPEFAAFVIGRSLRQLRRRLQALKPRAGDSAWAGYTTHLAHYSDDAHTSKLAFVTEALAAIKPRRVLDVGCNTGVYSNLAADAGAGVVSIDKDLAALSRLATASAASGRDILPLRVDLARPTPATGWENRETASFLDRALGAFDTVLALAIIHHLLLSEQIPMPKIAGLFSQLTTGHLVIEWVPPTDPKFRELLRGRDEIYRSVDEEAFRSAFAVFFHVVAERTLDNGRILLHLRKRP